MRLVQVHALQDGWTDWSVDYPSQTLDPERRYSGLAVFEYRYEGRSFIFYSFLFALIAAVFYAPLGFLGLAVPSMVGGLVTALAAYGMARELRLRSAWILIGVVALLSPVALYSIVFWEHALTAATGTLGLYLSVRASRRNSVWLWFGAGAVSALGIWFHELMMPYPVALGIGAVWVHRREAVRPVLAVAAGAALVVAPLAIINLGAFGTLLGPHMTGVGLGSVNSVFADLQRPGIMAVSAFFTLFFWGDSNPFNASQFLGWLRDPSSPSVSELQTSFVMAIPILGWLMLVLSGLWRHRWGRALAIGCLFGVAADGLWVAMNAKPTHSLFHAFPFIAFAFAANLRRTGDERDPNQVARQLIMVVTLAYTGFVMLKPMLAGTEWGSRYLLAVVAPLTVLGWAAIDDLSSMRGANDQTGWSLRTRGLLLVGVTLLSVSVPLQIRAFRLIDAMHHRNNQLTEVMRRAPDHVILTDKWWLAPVAAPAYGSKQILLIGDDWRGVPRLLATMKRRGVRTFSWIGTAPDRTPLGAGMEGYQLLGESPPPIHDLSRARYQMPGTSDIPE